MLSLKRSLVDEKVMELYQNFIFNMNYSVYNESHLNKHIM